MYVCGYVRSRLCKGQSTKMDVEKYRLAIVGKLLNDNVGHVEFVVICDLQSCGGANARGKENGDRVDAHRKSETELKVNIGYTRRCCPSVGVSSICSNMRAVVTNLAKKTKK